jgi:hypothetical protein
VNPLELLDLLAENYPVSNGDLYVLLDLEGLRKAEFLCNYCVIYSRIVNLIPSSPDFANYL